MLSSVYISFVFLSVFFTLYGVHQFPLLFSLAAVFFLTAWYQSFTIKKNIIDITFKKNYYIYFFIIFLILLISATNYFLAGKYLTVERIFKFSSSIFISFLSFDFIFYILRKIYLSKEKKQIILFFAGGLVTAIIYFLLLFIMIDLLNINYKLVVTIAFTLASLFNFFWHKKVSFVNNEKKVTSQLTKYLILTIINYFITMIITIVIVEFFELSVYFATIVSVLITSLVSFLSMKFLIFSQFDLRSQ